ncbi:MAG: hypothetical protein E7146_07055 [Rikenellaceae bacterium]|nr:hypothetical protein [Rikenellaceae bacterium]
MGSNARVIVSIVISGVLIGLVVSYCIRTCMPSETIDWVMWIAMAAFGISAVLRIALLSKQLNSNKEE